MSQVNLPRNVPYEELERALVNAAEDVGWHARVEHKYSQDYKLGSVEEIQEYSGTQIHLRGRLLPAMRVITDKREVLFTDRFFIWTGLPFGFASKGKVKRYLEAVSRNLSGVS